MLAERIYEVWNLKDMKKRNAEIEKETECFDAVMILVFSNLCQNFTPLRSTTSHFSNNRPLSNKWSEWPHNVREHYKAKGTPYVCN